MKRAIPSFFLRHSIPNRGRNFSNTSTGILKTFVWLPAIKTRDSATQEIISREVLSPSQAKQHFAQGLRGVDPWGHAAAQIIVDGVDGGRNEIIEKIQELAVINQVVPLRDASSIRSFQVYLSLYPDYNKPGRGRQFTAPEEQEWTERTKTKNQLANDGKALSLTLFNTEYAATNNHYEGDVFTYGAPDSTENFSRGLDFLNIVDTCFKIMAPVVRGNTIILETALPSASYFGKAMLDEHRLITKILNNTGKQTSVLDKNNENIHVCTTANLVLFKAGLGEDQYYELVKQVIEDNPELKHGFPITHFAHAFFNTLSQHPEHKDLSVIKDEPDSTRHENKI